MTILMPSLLGIATLLTLGLHAVPAQATSVRTFVASTGNDANAASNCPRTAPCRNFSTAFGVTTAGGEIVALELRSYGDNNIDGNADLDPTPVVIGKK